MRPLALARAETYVGGLQQHPGVSEPVKAHASTELGGGVPFVSDKELEKALADANVPAPEVDSVLEVNESGRIVGLRTALAVLALLALVALFLTGRIPDRQPGAEAPA